MNSAGPARTASGLLQDCESGPQRRNEPALSGPSRARRAAADGSNRPPALSRRVRAGPTENNCCTK